MATNRNEAEWDALMLLAAEDLEPHLHRAFLETVDRLRQSYTLKVIEDAVTTGKLDILIENLARSPQAYAPLVAAVSITANAAAQNVMDHLEARVRAAVVQPAVVPPGAGVPGTGGSTGAPKTPPNRIGVIFDGYNPRAVDYVRQQSSRLVVQVTDQVRGAIKSAVEDGIKNGTGTAKIAREIRTFIGLTPTQQTAVRNYRRMLEDQDPEALNRALRDHRFDPTLARSLKPGAPKLTAEQIDRQVEAYRERTLNMRAETIARTEAITALNTGQKAAWRQVVDEGGVLEGDVRRFWHVARDERTCEVCKPIPRMNPEGVGLDDLFATPDGYVDGPSMHPRCRCTVFVRPFFR